MFWVSYWEWHVSPHAARRWRFELIPETRRETQHDMLSQRTHRQQQPLHVRRYEWAHYLSLFFSLSLNSLADRKILDILKGDKPQVTFNCDDAGFCRFQFWIGLKESFYCGMSECESGLVVGTKYNTTKYDCQKIKCNCIPGRILCGASTGIGLLHFGLKLYHCSSHSFW